MPLHILGLNHTTAPVEIREQVVFAGDDIDRALASLLQLDNVAEAVVLSTCNRTEFYVETTDEGVQEMRAWLLHAQKLGEEVDSSLFTLNEEDAIGHLFKVACGLDSMVLGEPQILGQLKDAFRQAEQCGTVGTQLNRLFHHTFSVAKKVRTDTEIGSSPVSVAYAAVNLANQFFSGFSQHTALLIGAGVTIELVAKHLYSKGIGRLFIANRNIGRAQNLATQFDGFALPLSELEGTLPDADILISSTASTEPVVRLEQMEKAIQARKRKPVFAVDIAVPRDLEPGIGDLPDVYLYSIDDLDKVIVAGQNNREEAAVDAMRILEDETRRYLSIQRSKEVAPVITALRDHGDAIREQVLEQARRRLAKGADSDEVLEFVTSSLLKKILHQPSVRLREAGEQSDQEFIDAVSELFGLNKKN
ncbi:MAG: glutamyl-tRNA reductase [Gammaproteobacteria bacterium]|nr:MAG: glutamyl-tRNA reductase [Gammaproteobacteria bacterium]RLA30710.1 MAG: glutamyl-tRNA reductase [Gammaproteobacteria bacterium]